MKVLPYFFTCLLLQTACCFGMQEPQDSIPKTLADAALCLKSHYHNIKQLEQELAQKGRKDQDISLMILKELVLHKSKEADGILHPGKKLRSTPKVIETLKLKFLADFPQNNAFMQGRYDYIKDSATPHPAPAPAEREAS